MLKLTKLSDDYFKGNHPNKIYAGNVYENPKKHKLIIPKVGERFYFENLTSRYFSTSIVKEILNSSTTTIVFKTLYSTYKLELS